jgi:hypothetical protein
VHDEGTLKKPITPVQMGVVVVGLLIALGFGAKTFFGGGEANVSVDTPIAPTDTTPNMAPTNVTIPPPPVISPNPPAAVEIPPPVELPFTIVTLPNNKFNVGTMGVVMTRTGVTPREAAATAVALRQKMMRGKKWLTLHIYVFADRDAAVQFQQFQSRRSGAPLGPGDFSALSTLWPKTIIRYEYNRGAEGFLIPSQSPNSWWTGRTVYSKVKN